MGWASTSHGSRRSQSSLHLSPPQVALRQRGNADKLRASAPSAHTNTPDTDKLLRLLGDALTIAGVIGDDSQISLDPRREELD